MWLQGLRGLFASGKGSAFVVSVAALYGAHEVGIFDAAKWPITALGAAFMVTRAAVELKHGPTKE